MVEARVSVRNNIYFLQKSSRSGRMSPNHDTTEAPNSFRNGAQKSWKGKKKKKNKLNITGKNY